MPIPLECVNCAPTSARSSPILLLLIVAYLLMSPGAFAQTVSGTDLIKDFQRLTTMRPRACVNIKNSAPVAGWLALPAQCAWQGRLRLERWSAPRVNGKSCVSPAAVWWARARQRLGPGSPGAWQAQWTSQIIRDDSGGTKRLALIRQDEEGNWSASEWTWLPSDRPATRVWQQGRWASLAAQAGQLAQASRIAAGAPAAPLFGVWEQHLGPRPAEIRADIGFWPLQGRCMVLDMAGIADSRFQLPYLLDDSRLEQRAAMQLQLARRYPKATWLRTFRALPADPNAQHGRAGYVAVWSEAGWVRGQLWIPTKGDGPVLRMRIGNAAPRSIPGGRDEALETNARLIEEELAHLARRWRSTYD